MAPLDRLAARTPPIAALGVAVVAVSTSAILVRFSQAPNLVKALYRVLFTLVLLAPITLLRYDPTSWHLRRRDVGAALLTGVALAVHFATWFESLDWTSVAASTTLVQSQPVFVAIGSYLFLDERVDRRVVGGIVVAIAGVGVMTLLANPTSIVGARPILGNTLALTGALMAAAYVLAGRSLRQRVELLPYVTIVYTVCVLALAAFALLDGVRVSLTAYPPREWALFLGMAVGPGVFGHTVINWALEHVESNVVSVSLLGEPVGSTLLAVVFLGEVPGVVTVLGGVIVLGGIYITVSARRTTTS